MNEHEDTAEIRDWDTFHDVFQKAFGFPSFYGREQREQCSTSMAKERFMSSAHER